MGHSLKIVGLMSTDSGYFQCMGVNSAGKIQAVAQLIVLDEGNSLSPVVTCIVYTVLECDFIVTISHFCVFAEKIHSLLFQTQEYPMDRFNHSPLALVSQTWIQTYPLTRLYRRPPHTPPLLTSLRRLLGFLGM